MKAHNNSNHICMCVCMYVWMSLTSQEKCLSLEGSKFLVVYHTNDLVIDILMKCSEIDNQHMNILFVSYWKKFLSISSYTSKHHKCLKFKIFFWQFNCVYYLRDLLFLPTLLSFDTRRFYFDFISFSIIKPYWNFC